MLYKFCLWILNSYKIIIIIIIIISKSWLMEVDFFSVIINAMNF